MPGGSAKRLATGALVASAMALVVGVRLLPLALDGVDDGTRADATYRAADGREYVYLGDADSYAWLRSAATLLRSGSTCDAIVDGQCRDTFADAPTGRVDLYHGSLHVAAIAALHRLLTVWWPGRPLAATAFLIPVLVGALGVPPAFALGRRLAGDAGGWCAAVLVGVNPLFLDRSIGADNDVWNVVLPLCMVWAASAGLGARRVAGQIAGAVAAAACAALHATVWRGWTFTYDVLLIGLLGHLLIAALRHALRRTVRVWHSPGVRRAALVLGVFYVSTGILTTASGREPSDLDLPALVIAALHDGWRAVRSQTATADAAVPWPNAFGSVAEGYVPTLAQIAALLGGQVFFFGAWLGLLLLLLPRRGWRPRHYALLLGGNFLYRYLLHAAALPQAVLIAWLAVPPLAALSMRTAAAEEADDDAAAIVVVIWFLAALYLSYSAVRMVLLLVAPFGLALGVALGRLHEWLRERGTVWLPRAPRLAAALPVAVTAALILMPIRRGAAEARGYVPEMNDAWWDTLAALREQSPPDAIVTTWWDFGYWVKFAAARRTTADGGSLRTRIPLWTAQVLLAADERESIGLLRMLDCGSDGRDGSGAFGVLLADGVSVPAAYDAVRRITREDAAAAGADLDALGVSPAARQRVLSATHCVPPPAYLLLSTRTVVQDAWRQLGSWDPRQAGGNPSSAGLLTPDWVACAADGGALLCPIGAAVDANGTRIESVRIDGDHPVASRLRLRSAADAVELEAPPAMLLLAGADRLDEVPFPSATPGPGVLLDVGGRRVLVGRPEVLRSTFAQLVFLDGRYARRFKKVDERSTHAGERVVTYRIDWDG